MQKIKLFPRYQYIFTSQSKIVPDQNEALENIMNSKRLENGQFVCIC